jgi:hypothetical protein
MAGSGDDESLNDSIRQQLAVGSVLNCRQHIQKLVMARPKDRATQRLRVYAANETFAHLGGPLLWAMTGGGISN